MKYDSLIITCVRKYKKIATMGEMYVNGHFLGYTLEDLPRPFKIAKETCIPEGTYRIKVTYSTRFKRDMPQIYSVCEKDTLLVNVKGMTFSGVRIHGGNDVSNTEGCPLLGENTNEEDRVWGCKFVNEELMDILKNNKGRRIYYVVSSEE